MENTAIRSEVIAENPLFSTRTRNCLASIGVHTVPELTKLSAADILEIPCAGVEEVWDAKVALGFLGFSLQATD